MSFRPPAARIFADITGLVLLVGSPSLLANQTGRTET